MNRESWEHRQWRVAKAVRVAAKSVTGPIYNACGPSTSGLNDGSEDMRQLLYRSENFSDSVHGNVLGCVRRRAEGDEP